MSVKMRRVIERVFADDRLDHLRHLRRRTAPVIPASHSSALDGAPGFAYACDKLWPIECLSMVRRRRPDLMPNVPKRRKMILQFQNDSLHFSERPEDPENDAVEPTSRSELL